MNSKKDTIFIILAITVFFFLSFQFVFAQAGIFRAVTFVPDFYTPGREATTGGMVFKAVVTLQGATIGNAWFEWGESSLPTKQTSSTSIGGGTNVPYENPIFQNIQGLNPDQYYYYRVVAQDSFGTRVYGDVIRVRIRDASFQFISGSSGGTYQGTTQYGYYYPALPQPTFGAGQYDTGTFYGDGSPSGGTQDSGAGTNSYASSREENAIYNPFSFFELLFGGGTGTSTVETVTGTSDILGSVGEKERKETFFPTSFWGRFFLISLLFLLVILSGYNTVLQRRVATLEEELEKTNKKMNGK